MSIFYYQARNNDGQLVTGQLEASDLQDAISQVDRRGLSLESIGTVAPLSTQSPVAEAARPIITSPDDVVRRVFRSHLEKVLERAQSLVPALKAFSEEPSVKLHRGELERLIRIIERGDLAQAEQAFAELPDYWIPLISTAMASNDPGRILQE